MQIKTYYVISNPPGGSRHDVYTWACHGNCGTVKTYVTKVKKYFASKQIKWYCYYQQTVDTETGELSVKVLDTEAVVDVPPLEVNVEAKNNKKPIKFKDLEIEF